MKITFVTLFPEIISASVNSSILARAHSNGIVDFFTVNPRDFTYDRHHSVDDTPFAGEPGMLMKAEPIALAIESIANWKESKIIFTEPSGVLFTHSHAQSLANEKGLIFVCGHYEGIDARLEEYFKPEIYSIGDFILTGGELPSLLMTDAIARQIPGVLGNNQSLSADSFSQESNGILSAPNYTRPEVWRGIKVPKELISGNHKAIRGLRETEAQRRTKQYRPDLLSPRNEDQNP